MRGRGVEEVELDPTRIADLRRRLQADPTSIAFAQLAEEYRRARHLDEAVDVCQEGLRRHPGYLSARITLGRALAELGRTAEAERELEHVLRSAPDNLPALRGLAEIHEKQGSLRRALSYYRRALELARYDPDLDETVRAIAEELDGPRRRAADEGLSFEQAREELLDAPSRVPLVPSRTKIDLDQVLESLGYDPGAPAPPVVEAWLSGQPPAPPPAAASGSEPRSEPPASDVLAQLEYDLRQLEQHPPSPHGFGETSEVSTATEGRVSTSGHLSTRDSFVLFELERWLAAIEEFRAQKAEVRSQDARDSSF